jgi:hypothetical protein
MTFAFVRECFEATGDLVLGMVPLFAPAIKRRAGKVFDPGQFSSDLADIFGLKMNPLAAEDLAPRLAKAGLLINRAPGESSTQYINSNPEIPTSQQTAEKVDKAVARIIDFVQMRLRAANIYVSDERIEDEFFLRLLQLNSFSIDLIQVGIDLSAVSSRTIQMLRKEFLRATLFEILSHMGGLCPLEAHDSENFSALVAS